MTKLPKSVKVSAFNIDIEDWKHHSASARESHGEFSSMEDVIRVDGTMNPVKIVNTLIHEIGHAIYWAYGMEDEDKEERIVATFATAWTQIFRDSPEVLEFISKTLDGERYD